MQKLIFVFVMLMGAFGFSSLKAQIAPTNSGIFFQAVARDNYSNPAKDRTVYVEASIIQNAANGTKVLTELFQTTTDGLGVFSISIGSGTRIGGTLSGLDKVDWANGPYFLGLKIAIKPLSPVTNWDYTKELIDLGASAFGTVPYAFYSAGTASVKDQVKTTDTAAMLLPYAKKTDLTLKVNLADSSTIYVTPTQLRAVKFDTTSIYASLNQKEILANKSTSVTTDATSDVKYPSVRAIKSYVDLQFSNFVLADGSVTTAKLADGAVTDAKIVSVAGSKVTGDIAGNAATATLAASATKLATPRTINGVAFDGTSNITIATGSTVTDADATTKGVVQLAGDLTGTAAQPRIANGAVTDAKIVSVAGSKVTGDIAGNAATATLAANATKLATPRTINGVAFDGTSNITIATGSTVTDADATTKGVVQLAGDLTGTAAQPRIANGAVTDAKIVSVAGSKVTGDIAGNAATATLAANATNAVNATNATLAANATKLATPRTINGVAFDGTSNITIATGSNPIDADANTKGIVQLAGDLTGTAAQPRIANGAVTNTKIADVAATKITGAVAVANGGTGATTAAGARTNLGLVIGTDVLAQRTFGSAANNSTTDFIAATDKGANNGVATLGNDGKIPSTQIPAISFQSASVVANQTAMLALANQQVGSIAIRTDNNKNYVLSALPATTLANWVELATPTSVTSVNGNAGPNVVLTAADIAGVELASNKSNDVSVDAASTTKFPTVKSIKDYVDQQSANAGVADNSITSAKINGAIAIAKGGTGATTAAGARANLGLVIGTDVMSATAATTLTGDVTGSGNGSFATTVNSVGGVSSTTIATLPTSINANTSSITALDTRVTSNTADILLRAPVNSPIFTGTPTAPTPATSDNSTKVATTEYVKNSIAASNAGISTIGSISASSNAKGATISGTTELILTPADASNGGVVTTGAQTFAGTKTFNNAITAPNFIGNASTATKLAATKNINGVAFDGSANITIPADATTLSGIVPIASGGTGSSTKNFVDLTNAQTIAGTKTFSLDAYFNGVRIGKGASDNIQNTTVGYTTLGNNTTGAGNTAIGFQGQMSGTSGSSNTSLGFAALIDNLTGSSNTAIGYQALQKNKGSNNIAIGTNTMYLSQNSNDNIVIGNSSLDWSTNGAAGNIILGKEVMRFTTTGSNNIVLGNAAGSTFTTENNNTLIGASTNITAGVTNATAVGNGAIVNASNRIQLGNSSVTSVVTSGTISATGFTGPLSGNASTATKLAASKNINGVAFDGSSDITIATNSNTLTGTTLASNVINSGLTSVGTITSGTWSGTTIAVANGGTGATTAADARTNLGLVIGTDVMSATATTTLTGDVTGSGNGSFATTVNSVGGVSSSTIATLPTSVNANTASITANTADILLKAPINSPTFTGTPTAPTPATSDNSTKIATTEYVKASITASNAGLSSIGAISGTSNAKGATISGTNELILTPADAANGGVLTNGTQSIAGSKTFESHINVKGDINSAGTVAIRYQSGAPTWVGSTIGAGKGGTGLTSPGVSGNVLTSNGIGWTSSAVNAGTLTGTILASNVTVSSLSIVGTITSGTWSGTTISAAKGGTGLTSPGASGNILTSDGTNWVSSAPAVSGVSSLTYSSTSATNGGTISGTTLTLAAADANNPGLISTGTQTIAGDKTFNNQVSVPSIVLNNGSAIWQLGAGVGSTGISLLQGGCCGRLMMDDNGRLAIGANYAPTTFQFDVQGNGRFTQDVTAPNFLGNATTATTAGNITATANTTLTSLSNLNTVGTITSGTWSGTTIGSNVGGAGTVNGLLKANGSGVVSAAVAGTDYQGALTAGSGISISAGTISATGLTTSNLASNAAITNAQLANSSTTLGSTTMTLGGTVTSVTGLTSLTATTLVGTLSGTATTATNITGGAIGAMPYQSAAGTTVLLAGNITSTVRYLASSGNGTNSTAPTWVTPSFVPYTGATGAVNLGAYDLTVNGITVGRGNTGVETNTALGGSVLQANTAGTDNTAVGYYALKTTTGSLNSAFGSLALKTNTSGTRNAAFGTMAIQANSTGNNNSGFGYGTLYATTASDNTGIGYLAGYNVTTGAKNIFIGSLAGNSISTASTANTTGLNSVLIGYDVRPLANGDNNEIVVSGYNGTAGTVGLGSNTTLIGNTSTQQSRIYGALTVTPNTATGAGNSSTIAAQNAGGTNTDGGALNLTAGNAGTTGQGGNIVLTPGTSTTAANNGIVRVNGQVQITGGNPGAGEVLMSDANGLASWSYSIGSTVVTSTTTYAITLAEAYVFYTGSAAGNFTIPAAASTNAGKEITIKNKTAFGITITPASGTIFIDSANTGAANVTIGIEASNNWIKLISDGTQWNVIRALF